MSVGESSPHRRAALLAGAACGALLVVGLSLAWRFRPADVSMRPNYWTSALNTLAVGITFIAVWWTTLETARLRHDAKEAGTAAQETHVVIRRRLTVRHTGADAHAGWDYVALNLGPGTAKRVFYTVAGDLEPLSGLLAGAEQRLSDQACEDLRAEMRNGQTRNHLVIAETFDGRWFLSDNVVTGSGEIANISGAWTPDATFLMRVAALVESHEQRLDSAWAEVQASREQGR